jgi:hypothetical protein
MALALEGPGRASAPRFERMPTLNQIPQQARGCQPPPRIAFLAVSKAVAAILRNPEVARYSRLLGLPLGHR